jgi:hypothetical protein
VIDGIAVQRANHGQLVRNGGRVRQEITDPLARLAVAGELEVRAGYWKTLLIARHQRDALCPLYAGGQLLAVHLVRFRFVVEQVEMRWTPGHKQMNDTLRSRREVQSRRAGRRVRVQQ